MMAAVKVAMNVAESLGAGNTIYDVMSRSSSIIRSEAKPSTKKVKLLPAPKSPKAIRKTVVGTNQQTILDWAKSHEGEMKVREMRASNLKDHLAPTFLQTTIFTELKKLTENGLMKKTGPGQFILTDLGWAA